MYFHKNSISSLNITRFIIVIKIYRIISFSLDVRAEFSCTCNKPDDEEMIECSSCSSWYHYDCAELVEIPGEEEPCFCERFTLFKEQSMEATVFKNVNYLNLQKDDEFKGECFRFQVGLKENGG